jgi:acyl transferase domain-containing protein/acyl carrier protein
MSLSAPIDYAEQLKRALIALRDLRARAEAAEAAVREPVAAVGIGLRFPGGVRGPAAFWRLLSDGVDAITEVPPDRWNMAEFYDADPEARGKISVRFGGFLDGIDRFDAPLFNVSPREAAMMDPQQRLLLEVAWAALEHAGIAPDALGGSRTGVFIGVASHDYLERVLAAGPQEIDSYVGSGNASSVAAGRLSYTFGLKGPCVALDTACSSSLVAVHLACQSLRAGECAMALAGGVNLLLSPTISINHSRARMLATDGRCKAFSASADGFVRSEGCGVVVLKRLADAQRDGDRVLAVLRGSATNHDGRTSGLTVPNGPAQQEVIRAALAQAAMGPAEVDYVEAHGTGTALGDPIEMGALAAVFGPGRPKERPLFVGAVKTNLGHCEAAAGVAGLIKAILAVGCGRIPAHLHFTRPNPLISWADMPWVRIPTTETVWPGGRGRVAGVSSFGFGGTNAHVVVGEAPPLKETEAPERGGDVLILAAKTGAALNALASRYSEYFSGADPAPWADVCYTAATGRAALAHRLAVTATDAAEAARKLSDLAAGSDPSGCWRGVVSGRPRIAFLFSGQGSLYAGMGSELLASSPIYRAAFEECCALVRHHAGWNLAEAVESAHMLARTEYGQVALFAVEYSLSRVWASWGIVPDAVVGHSVGEYAAACAAGALPLESAMALLIKRARLMGALGDGGAMAAVPGTLEDVAAVRAKHGVELAAVNSPRQVVITGERGAVDAAVADLKGAGLLAQALEVNQGYHSRQMEPMLADFGHAAEAMIPSGAPETRLSSRFISTVTGAPANIELATADYWIRQVRQPVLFAEALRALNAEGIDFLLEVGPRGVLVTLGQQTWPEGGGEWLLSLRPGRGDWAQMLESASRAWLLGAPVAWREVYRGFARPRAELPTYPFQGQRHWCAEPRRSEANTGLTYELAWEPVAPFSQVAAPARWRLSGGPDCWREELARELGRRGASVTKTGAVDAVGFIAEVGRSNDPVAAAGAECQRLLALVQNMLSLRSSARLWIVTRGAVAAAPGDGARLALAGAPIWAFARALALEHPELFGGSVDLPADEDSGDPARVVDAWCAAGTEDQLAWRSGGWLGARLRRLPLPEGSAAVRADGSYLISGGLGALGLRVAEWLIQKGARSLVLAGRRPPTPGVEAVLERLRAAGARIVARSLDVADAGEVRGLLDEVGESLPRLRGVVHAAGIAGYEPVAGLTDAALASVLRPKVSGAWALHEATRGMELDFFVLFSSVAAAWGSKGQAHYGAANGFLDGLAQHRRALGLPALSIAWGPWAGGGMATDAAQAQLARIGLPTLEAREALVVLERSLASGAAGLIAARVDWPRFQAVFESRRQGSLLAHLCGDPKPASGAPTPPESSAMFGELASLAGPARIERLRMLARAAIARVLRLPEGELPEPRQGFTEMGVDSLMAVEIRNQLAKDIGLKLPATLIFNYPNVEMLARHLATLVKPLPEPRPAAESASSENAEARALIAAMSEAEAEALLLKKLEEL